MNYSDTSRESGAALLSKWLNLVLKFIRQCCKTTRPINEGLDCAKVRYGKRFDKNCSMNDYNKGHQAIFAAVGERRGKNAASELYDLYKL
jgi:hypothetical protein